jgi:hypothetical protein
MRFVLRLVVRLILLAVVTFGFVVLFEHGPARFTEGAKEEWNALLFFAGAVLSRQEGALGRPRGQTSSTAASSPSQASSPAQKAPQAGPTTNRPATGTPPPNR